MRNRILVGILCTLCAFALTPTAFAQDATTPAGDLAQQIWDQIVKDPSDPFGYNGDKSDGCWARSILICKAIDESGMLPPNCFTDTVFAWWPPGAFGNWRYHQACTVTCYTENGTETFVMDGLKPGPMSVDDWNTAFWCEGGAWEHKEGDYYGYYCQPVDDEAVEDAEEEVEARRGGDGDGKPKPTDAETKGASRMTRLAGVSSNPTSNGCAAAYATTSIFIDPATGWEYYYQVVTDIQYNGNGNMVLGIGSLQAWVEVAPGTPQAFIDAATTSYTDGTPVHVAIDHNGGVRNKANFQLPHPFDQIQWVDPLFQHPSCN